MKKTFLFAIFSLMSLFLITGCGEKVNPTQQDVNNSLNINGTSDPSPASDTSKVLYSFSQGTDGVNPHACVIFDSNGNLYGTTYNGGLYGEGTIFKLAANGQETILHSFSGKPDGANPYAGLIMDGSGNLYGTTYGGGDYGDGTVFKLAASGQETILHSFSGSPDGANPYGGLILDNGGNLYGTTYGGGDYGEGTVFKLAAGGQETVLYSFFGGITDGANSYAGLIRDSTGSLYGTTYDGGVYGFGTVFKLAADGQETILHSFSGGSTDGANPYAGLIMDSNGNLYGTTYDGGVYGFGTVFKLAAGGQETVLYSFSGGSTDGANSYAELILDSKGNLYGTTYSGGTYSLGTVFELDTSGKETVLYSFSGSPNGASPYAGLIMDSNGNLYGTTYDGGTYSYGTVFKVSS